MTDYASLVARLRERLVKVPKPGTTPYTPHSFVEMTVGGGPYKPGDGAGLCFNQTIAYTVQEHIYAGEPLAYEAADAIEALRADAMRYRWLREPQEHSSVEFEDENEDGYNMVFYSKIREELDLAVDAAMVATPVAGPTEPAT